MYCCGVGTPEEGPWLLFLMHTKNYHCVRPLQSLNALRLILSFGSGAAAAVLSGSLLPLLELQADQ